METPTPTSPPGPVAPAPAVNLLAPDPILAGIMAKHAAGQRLTPQEYGKLGAYKARAGNLALGRPPKPTPAGPAPGGPGQVNPRPAVAPLVAGPAAAPGGAPVAPVDPDLIRRTTAAILTTCDQAATAMIGNAARQAGADSTTQRMMQEAAALQSGPRDLMISTSPEVIAALGVDATNYPVAAFLSGLGIWAGSLAVAMGKLNAMAKERIKDKGQSIKETETAEPDKTP